MNVKAIFAAVALVGCVGCGDTMSSNPPSTTPVGTSGSPTVMEPTDPTQVESSRRGLIPVGQELDIRLQERLSSETATAEQRFEATTAVDVMQGSRVLIPAGSTVRGVVRSVDKAGNIDRTGKLTLAFDQVTVRGRNYPLRAMATQVFESRGIKDEAKTVGTGGAVGAIIGGIIGGLKGALIGAVVGAGGVIAATEGKDVTLEQGTIIRVRLDEPLQLQSS
jgi:hypothetical protein